MAKTVKPFELRLKVLGDEAVKKLGSSFRDLDKALNISNNEIKKLRKEVLGYNKEGQQSEQLIKGQITALKALQGQVEVNGRLYQKLGNNVADLKAKLLGTTASVQAQREAILKNVNAQKLSSATASKYIAQLKKLQNQTVKNSQASKQFEQDISSLTQKMRELKRQEIGQLGKGTVEFSKGATTNLGRLINRLGDLGRASKTALGAWTRTVEGIGALGVVGAGAKGITGAGLMATGAAQGATGGLANYLASAKEALSNLPVLGDRLSGLVPDAAISKVAELTSSIASLDSQLDLVNQGASAVTSTLGQLGPEAAAAGIAAGSGIAIFFDLIKRRSDKAKAELDSVIQSIDDKVQRTLQSLARLEDQMSGSKIAGLLGQARAGFAATPAGSYRSRSMASQIAGLEALAVQEAAAQADVLEHYRKRVRGTREDAQALGDRLAYVQGKLKTLDQTTEEGRAEFAQYSNEAISLTDKLNKLADGYRHVSTMATQAATAQENAANAATRLNYFNFGAAQAQRQAMAELGQRVRAGVAGTPLALPAAGQTSAPGTGAAISGGARQFRGQVETTFDDPNLRIARTIGIGAGYFNPPTAAVGQPAAVGMSEQAIAAQAASAKRAALDLTQYEAAISKARQANTGSISSTNNLRQALVALRDQVDPTGKRFKELGREIEALDARAERFALRQKKRRFGTREMAATAGAVASSAIFGGPEGAIGAALGAFGGPGGAIAGGALGAQAGMLRQSLGEMTKYSAQLEKMRIALKGVAGEGIEYNRALAASRNVTDRFNVEQGAAITGMTRLTAAVTGAKGNVTDASLVFNNVTAAIKATGGSSEDVNSAITAMVQVFSKGKVSAEELSGQLGERLPGAVTMFAEANNMSLTELQKNLRDGTVGLNELMKFVEELGRRYGDTADEIAKSPQEAGARLQVLINDLRLQIGKALEPVGAEIQDAIGSFIKENREDIVRFAVSTAEAFSNLLTILNQYGPVIANVLKFAAVTAILGRLIPVIKGVGVGFNVAAVSMGLFNKASFATLRQMALLKKAALGLRAVAGNIVFAVAIVGADLVINYFNRIKRAREGATEALKGKRGAEYITALGGDDLDRLSIKQAIAKEERDRKKAEEDIARLRGAIPLKEQVKFEQRKDPLKPEGYSGSYGQVGPYEAQLQELYEAQEQLNLSASRLRTLQIELSKKPQPEKTKFASPKPEGDEDGKGKGKIQMTQQEADLRIQILRHTENEEKIQAIQKQYQLDVLEANKEGVGVQERRVKLAEADVKQREAIFDLMKGIGDLAIKQREQQRGLNAELQDRQYELGIITEKEYNRLLIERERARLRDAYPDLSEGKREEMVELKRREIDPTFAEALQSRIKDLKDELKELTNPVNALVNGATAIGNAFSTSFTNVISGSQSAKEALADFFKNVGAYFLDMANQIIAKMIVLALLNSLAKLLPTGGEKVPPQIEGSVGAASETGITLPSGLGQDMFRGAAADGAYWQGGFNAFANGGVVSKPTFGLVGEGGEAEYIIPSSKMRSAMKRYSAGARGSAVIPPNGEQGAPGLGGAGVEGGPIDVRYTVERINSVDYVTADQFRSGMQEAAQRGAVQGEQRTLRRLQMSTSTRKRLGM